MREEPSVQITINGRSYAVKSGMTIIEVLDQQKIGLPRYCYHPGLSIAGNCRICQVEVEGMPRTVIACNTRVSNGMVIHTQSSKARESQKAVLEFLLANHPLDCPVCDQAGECKLQDYYMDYGVYEPRFDERKVKKTKKAFPVGPTIMLDQERCILCSRCVRFTDEVTKTHEFGIFKRGGKSEIDIYPGTELGNKYAGNVADICPVGALTDRDFRFKLRVWYLGKQKSVCPGCARGCNISIEYEKSRPYRLKNERVMRLKPAENPHVNRWWMCDEGRYGYRNIDFNRLTEVQTRGGKRGEKASWDQVLFHLADVLKETRARNKRWALIGSPQYTNEEIFLQKRIFRDALGWQNIGFRSRRDQGYEDEFLIKKDKNPNTSGTVRILRLRPGGDDIAPLLEKARKGELKGLFIFGRDLSPEGVDVMKIIREKVETIIFEGPNQCATAMLADFVLPGASYAEKEGTFTNFQGRVQRIRRAVEPMPDSRPAWRILTDLADRMGLSFTYGDPEQIFLDLAREDPAFHGLNYQALEPYGKVWNAAAAKAMGGATR